MSLRHAVLGLIVELDGASGYDLMKLFEISLANVWSATQSQLYGELAKLTADGLIEVAAEGPRGRKEYRATDSGREELRRWLVEEEPKPAQRDGTLLRVFFLGQLEPEQARAYLRDRAALMGERRDELAALQEQVPWGEDNLSFYGRLTMEYGRRFFAMRKEWSEWAEAELARLPAPGDRSGRGDTDAPPATDRAQP
ncbi:MULTISPECIES: PadR family transcriptional regulator [unclassified Nonomuraea]|uniref:PadR family transcriptional regulator n=1 Tax=unclassified Nonomuraea TaxID=2593643 RepID=UPI0033EB4CFC